MMICDLCGQQKDCQHREIEEREYDICAQCWNPIAVKLKGKGRPKKDRETVFLPAPPIKEPERKEQDPKPGEPPKIWGTAQ